jgi:GTP diphosphokinase / guanosine-3',5'-bis(diphosphate) 3'-diphosphatase
LEGGSLEDAAAGFCYYSLAGAGALMSEQESITAFVLRASKFACERHRDQKRKDGQLPYINHPIEVAELLSAVAGVDDRNILAAAVLHDTVEDTGTTFEELSLLFGKTVADLVMECTDNKSLPKAQRKQLQVEHAAHKSPAAKLIKVADKISNLRSIMCCPPPDWSLERKREYAEWARAVFQGLKGVNGPLDDLFEQTLAQARSRLSESAEAARP